MIDKLHTSCKDCAFAVYSGDTQTDCTMGRLDVIKEAGIEVLEVYDNEKEFYVINKAACTWKRNKDWAKKHANLEEQLRKEGKLLFQFIIRPTKDISALEQTIKNISEMTEQPEMVTVIQPHDNLITSAEIFQLFRKYNIKKWNVSQWLYQDNNIEETIKSVRYPYFAVLNAGEAIPTNLISKLGDMVHYKLFKFGIILPNKNGHCVICHTHIYNILNIKIEYLELLQKEKICKGMIHKITKLFPKFPK